MASKKPEESQPHEVFDISPEFIQENAKLRKVRPKKKDSRYSKAERLKRRDQVYHLYIEQSMPPLAVAEMLQVDKNVIDNDIELLYKELGREYRNLDFDSYVNKHMIRLEAQRGRLGSYLNMVQDFGEKLAIEKMIADVDSKMIALTLKMAEWRPLFWNAVYEEMNKVAKEKGLDWRFTNMWEGIEISKKDRNKMDEKLRSKS